MFIQFKTLPYIYISIFFVICVVICLVLPTLSYLISPQKKSNEKLLAYECGFEPFDDSRGTFDIHFFIVIILFILLDLEIALIFPWAFSLYFLGSVGFWSLMTFFLILTWGFILEWENGALNWSKTFENSLK